MLRSAVTDDSTEGYVSRGTYDELFNQYEDIRNKNQILQTNEQQLSLRYRELQAHFKSVQGEAEFRDTALSNIELQKNTAEGKMNSLHREIEVLKAAAAGRTVELTAAYNSISACEDECSNLRSQLYSKRRE